MPNFPLPWPHCGHLIAFDGARLPYEGVACRAGWIQLEICVR
jgi:hypothetical protein